MDILSSAVEEVGTKEKWKIIEMENLNLKSRLMQLEAQVNECFHVKLQKDVMDKKLSGLQMEMLKKQRRIRKLKSKTSKFCLEIKDKDNLLQKMTQHVEKIWILLLAFGNKLGKNGLLTIKEKTNIKNEYEEWFTLMVTLDKGKTEEVLKMLNNLPTSLFEVLNISECESEINPPDLSNEEDIISSSVLPTPKDKASSKSRETTNLTTQAKLDEKPQTKSYSKTHNCDQVTQSQVMKKTNKTQRGTKQISRISQYKAILRKNSSFSDNSSLLHPSIVSNFKSKTTVRTSLKNNSIGKYPAENKRTAILIPGPPMKISQKSLPHKKDEELEDSSLHMLPFEDASRRTQLSKSYDFHSNKKQKVSLNANTLDEAPVRLRGRTLENRVVPGKWNSQAEIYNEITEQSQCNKNPNKVDQTLENELADLQNKSEKDYTGDVKHTKIRKEHTSTNEKTSLDNVIGNKNEKLYNSKVPDSPSYKHIQLREIHESLSPKCITTTKDMTKILEQQTLDHIPYIEGLSSPKELKLLQDSQTTTINAYNDKHLCVETEPSKDNLSRNIIPYLSCNSSSKIKDLCQTYFEILPVKTKNTFFNSKNHINNEQVSISSKGRDSFENNIERNSDHIADMVEPKDFNDNERSAASDHKLIKSVGNIKIGFLTENDNGESDSECDLVIDEDFDNDEPLISTEIKNECSEEMKIDISKGKHTLDSDPYSKSILITNVNLNDIEQCITPKVKNDKSLSIVMEDICKGKENDSYPINNPSYSEEKANSVGIVRNAAIFNDNYGSLTAAEDTECEIISTCHNKVENLALKDMPTEQIEESSKILIGVECKPLTNLHNKQTNFTSACANEEFKLVNKTFDVGEILKLQSETLNFKRKNKTVEKDFKEKSSLAFFKKKNSEIKPNNKSKQRRKNLKKKFQKVSMDFTENSVKIKKFNLQSKAPDFNNKNKMLGNRNKCPGESNSTFPAEENSQIKPNNQSINNKRKFPRKIKLLKKKLQIGYIGNPLYEFFSDFKKVQFSQENFEQNVENLFLLLIDPSKTPNCSSLLFHVANYLRMSKSFENILLSFSSSEDLSILFPLDENCIVTTLFLIELEKKPHLKGLLNAAVSNFHHIIIAKKKFSVFLLASFCRVFTQICKCQGNKLKPVLLCGDLLKMKHKYASYLIASIASVWKELFQIGNNLPAEEVLFHSSILYGANQKSKFLTDCNMECSIKIISKYFTALPVNNARSAIHMLMESIQLRCKDDSCNNHYLATTLIILAAHEDWDWTEEVLLDKYIIPNLTKFGSETLNENAFDFYCNLYVDAFLLKPGNPLDTVLAKFFDSSDIFEGGNSVQESAALGLMRFVYLKNRDLPSFLSSWFKDNCKRPKVQQVLPYFQRRLMGLSLSVLQEEDILCI